MTSTVIAAPTHRRYAPCGLVAAAPSVPFKLPLFDFLQCKAGRK